MPETVAMDDSRTIMRAFLCCLMLAAVILAVMDFATKVP
jgi:hypothetical protein